MGNIMSVVYRGKARTIVEKEKDSSDVLSHSNGISRELIKTAEAGGDIFVYSLVPMSEMGSVPPATRKITADGSLMPGKLAHRPVEIEYVPPDIEVENVLSELVVHHRGARIVYPQGLASYDSEGRRKLGVRYFAYFPNKEDSSESYILNGNLVRLDCIEDPVCGYKYKMKVISAKDDVIIISQYSAAADPNNMNQNDFVLESARVLCPATAERLNVAPIERKFVVERMMDDNAEGVIRFLENDIVALLKATERGGMYQLLLENKNLEKVIPKQSNEFYSKFDIITKNHGIRSVTIRTLIPQFNDGLACSDFADAIMTEAETFSDILRSIYQNQHLNVASDIESYHTVDSRPFKP